MATETTLTGRKATAVRAPRFYLKRGFWEAVLLRLLVFVLVVAIWELAVGEDRSRLFNVSKPSLIDAALWN